MLTKKMVILNRFAAFFLLLGSIGWFLPFSGWLFRPWMELPNSEPHGIVIDSGGNIYCGSKFYGRIQKYHPDGRFGCGFDTEGGTGRGSDFGFRISENDQLCITVSGISKDNKGSVHRLRIYDNEGNLVHTEKSESGQRNYTHKMSDSTIDSNGNTYVFKGFLFPRVVKQTQAGDMSIIISTPLLIWFIQAPFPAFAFFFVSMIVLVFLGIRDKATKLSIPTIDLLVNRKNLSSVKKIIFFCIGILGIIILLSILIQVGLKTYPLLVIFGLLSFVITLAVIMLLIFISAILTQWRYAKCDFKSWKNSMFGSSAKIRYESMMSLRSINDSLINKTGTFLNKVGLFCFLAWFVILVMVVCIVLYLDHIGVWSDLISKYSLK